MVRVVRAGRVLTVRGGRDLPMASVRVDLVVDRAGSVVHIVRVDLVRDRADGPVALSRGVVKTGDADRVRGGRDRKAGAVPNPRF